MKIQTLNKEQKKKLLKLCKVFFPEYKYVELNVSNNPTFTKTTPAFSGNDEWLGIKDYDGIITYPWYQLCLTELPKRIWDKVEKDEKLIDSPKHGKILDKIGQGRMFRYVLTEECEHPVDFLWDFVEECKKNNYFKK